MKTRLLFSAIAFVVLALAAYFLHSSGLSPSVDSMAAASTQSQATNASVKDIAAVNAAVPNRPESKRESASAPAQSSPSAEFAALNELQSKSSKPWLLKRDDFSNQIRTLSGGGLAVSAASPRDAGDQFVQTYAKALFGVDPERVKFNRVEVTDRTRVIYDQTIDGIPVYGASLALFYENGSLNRVQNDLAPFEIAANSKPSPVLDAFSSYKETQAPLYDVSLQSHESNRVILYPSQRSLVYAYEFVTEEADKGASTSAKSFHVLYNADEKFIVQRRPSAIR